MPYIVITKERHYPCTEWKGAECHIEESRKAVSTLEKALTEVSEYVCNRMAGDNFGHLQDDFRAIEDNNGGSITLPNGTVIEVESVSWDYMLKATNLRMTVSLTHAEIIDAYNNR
jgi:hypothetical protein